MAKIRGKDWEHNFSKNLQKLEGVKSKMPIIMANEIKNHFQDGFKKGGYQTDASKSGWKRKRIRKKDEGRAILVKSGILRADIKIKKETFKNITVGTSSVTDDYAYVHNEGAGAFNKNEFIGKSRRLKSKLTKIINKQLEKIQK